MIRLRRIARNCSDLARAEVFYTDALGFTACGVAEDDAVLATVLGAGRVKTLMMRLGGQELELSECWPRGAPYPQDARADALCFQHIAIVTTDIFSAHAVALAAGGVPISTAGPQQLPAASGGVAAWKFRDPDGHPLELLQFTNNKIWRGDALHLGYDHSAISVSDTARSILFYEALGLTLRHRHLNQGAEQSQLDGLEGAKVEVAAMRPQAPPPHLELLGYQTKMRRAVAWRPCDIAADRLVFASSTHPAGLIRDPDGHYLLFEA